MKAMVFAAGYGQRLLPLTERVPKALVPVAGRPMIEYPLLLLRHYGIREVVINLHHLGEMIEAYLGDGKKLGLEIAYSGERELLDTGGGLLKAKSFLEGGRFIAINSDILIDIPLHQLIAFHSEQAAPATLVVRPDELADQYGAIETSGDHRVRRFLGHRASENESAGALTKYMFTGVQILEPEIFQIMEADSTCNSGKFSITRITYAGMLTRGAKLCGFPYHGYWQDLGTFERIKEAEQNLASGEIKLHYLT